jgi:two-component system LytT family response regulator
VATGKLASPNSLTLLIVDKEPSIRCELTELCGRVTDLRVLGEAESGRAAIDAADSLSPDVMLIDVALPDMSGFDVLRHARGCAGRLGIMTSEQPDLAELAAAEGAVDYLRKPVSASRFAQAIEKVRQRFDLEQAANTHTVSQLLRLLRRRPPLLVGERLRRLYPLNIERVDYIEADGNYVTIRVGNDEYLSRNSIKRLAAELAEFDFVRIDRSILLNMRAVYFAEPIGHGMLAFTLTSGACLHSSKRYREAILRVLPWHHCRAG